MTKEEFNSKQKYLIDDYNKKQSILRIQYANENNPYKIGDIVTDHMGSIEIESMEATSVSSKYPSMVYYGVELKKDLTHKKDMKKRQLFQINIKN